MPRVGLWRNGLWMTEMEERTGVSGAGPLLSSIPVAAVFVLKSCDFWHFSKIRKNDENGRFALDVYDVYVYFNHFLDLYPIL